MSRLTSINYDPDAGFFAKYPQRQAHIRLPMGMQERDEDFRTLGDHDPRRRRIIAWRVPSNAAAAPGQILRIPFLLRADESIADTDEVLMPFIHNLMMDAAKEHGIPTPMDRPT